MLIAVDPGCTLSAFVHFSDGRIAKFGKIPNAELLAHVQVDHGQTEIVYEMIACYGCPVGREVFETVLFCGMMAQASVVTVHRLYRMDVKTHLCHSPKANDGTIRQAIIDRYGGKEKAIGKIKTQGPLYGIKADCWSALALALTWADTRAERLKV